MRITATTVLSYVVCPRQAWLIHHQILPDRSNPFLELGRFIHERAYVKGGEKSVELPGMKMDLVWRENGVTVIGEVKKSSKLLKGARAQLLYYMKAMKDLGFEVKGYILVPQEKKRIEVKLGEKEEREIEELLKEVERVVSSPEPPVAVRKSICENCGYFELCWA